MLRRWEFAYQSVTNSRNTSNLNLITINNPFQHSYIEIDLIQCSHYCELYIQINYYMSTFIIVYLLFYFIISVKKLEESTKKAEVLSDS